LLHFQIDLAPHRSLKPALINQVNKENIPL
jgi:hypothetical protein